nr:MAG TPA: CI repressor [Bacteriophage sp.]
MNFATTKERIIQYIDFKGIKVKDFYEKTGIKRGFLDSDKLKSSVSDIFLTIILANFEDLDPIWLLTGEGPMLKSEPQPAVSSPQPQENDNNEIVSLLKDKIALLEKNNALLEDKIKGLEQEINELKKQSKYPISSKSSL